MNENSSVVTSNSRLRTPDSARIVTAAVGIPLVLLIVWLGGWVFSIFVACLAFLAMRELEMAHRKTSAPLVSYFAYPALLLILFFASRYALTGELMGRSAPMLFFCLWLFPVALLIIGVIVYPVQKKFTLISLALTNFAVLYVGLFAFLTLLQGFPRGGPYLFWIVLLGVWIGDSLAYFGGRKWGKTTLTTLSPKKTLEGLLIGVLATIVLSIALAIWFKFGVAHGIALGVLIAVATPLGDLAESFWKRELEVKDLGTILPGHGGVLDRCDSLLFASFAVYLYGLWRL